MPNKIHAFYDRCKRFAAKWDGPLALIGITAVVIVWAYSNFATAKEMGEAKNDIASAKTELRTYVDTRHTEVMKELMHQRKLQEAILLRVRH